MVSGPCSLPVTPRARTRGCTAGGSVQRSRTGWLAPQSTCPLKIRKARRGGQAFDTGGGVCGTDTARFFTVSARPIGPLRSGAWATGKTWPCAATILRLRTCTGQLFLLSLREQARRVARSAHVQRGQTVSFVLREQVRLFARVFHGQLFRSSGRGEFLCAKKAGKREKLRPFAHARHGQNLPILPTFAHGLPKFHGQLFSLDIPGG